MDNPNEYPAFLQGFTVVKAADHGLAPRPEKKQKPIDPADIVLQQQLAANAALRAQVSPYSKEGQERLKASREAGSDPAPVSNIEPPIMRMSTAATAPSPRALTYDEEYTPEKIEDSEIIPAEHFLLRSLSGDIFLKPAGFQDEEHFIVLYFLGDTLVFRPGLSTKFLGAVDSPTGERTYYGLYYSGIAFFVADVGKTALIFHKTAS